MLKHAHERAGGGDLAQKNEPLHRVAMLHELEALHGRWVRLQPSHGAAHAFKPAQ